MIFVFVLPSVLFIIIFGKQLMMLFGKSYSNEAYPLLVCFAFATLLASLNTVSTSIMNLLKKSQLVAVVSFFYSIVLLSGTFILLKYGLIGVGYSYILAHGLVAIFYAVFFSINRKIDINNYVKE